ncbi:Ff.00g055110.m01.CDS01 [Fusarium sp. VM40]|nr:Ff.00g055110.m01.CDS01 [Fusarium sp. VM40]
MNAKESACLIKCPGEICRLIFTHLLQEDLPAVCLSHRALRVHAEPLLYEGVYFEWREECYHPITSFLRSTTLRPQLAAYVRYFELTGGYGYDKPLDQAPKILLSEYALEGPLLWVARRTNIPYRESWMEELRNGTMEAFIAVVISQTTHLETLNIWPDLIRGTWLIGEVLRSMVFRHADHGLPSQLKQLRNVSMRENATSRDQTVEHYRNSRRAADLLLPFFYLSSVERIEAEIDNPVELSWPTKQPPRSNATSLELFHLRESFLAQILSATENLQSLRWEWYYDDRFDDGYALMPLCRPE